MRYGWKTPDTIAGKAEAALDELDLANKGPWTDDGEVIRSVEGTIIATHRLDQATPLITEAPNFAAEVIRLTEENKRLNEALNNVYDALDIEEQTASAASAWNETHRYHHTAKRELDTAERFNRIKSLIPEANHPGTDL